MNVPCSRIGCTARPEWLPTVGGHVIGNLPLCLSCRVKVTSSAELLDEASLARLPSRELGWVSARRKKNRLPVIAIGERSK